MASLQLCVNKMQMKNGGPFLLALFVMHQCLHRAKATTEIWQVIERLHSAFNSEQTDSLGGILAHIHRHKTMKKTNQRKLFYTLNNCIFLHYWKKKREQNNMFSMAHAQITKVNRF